jgi:predicted phage terminase large subunit-like protein
MDELAEEKAKLLGSLLLFIQVFYKIRTGREFEISHPIGRESHFIIVCRELTKVFRLETNRLLINIPPGHGKSEIMIHFIAWAMAHYPDSQFLYISYSHDLAAKHTATIKQIMEMTHYKKLFGVDIRADSSAKDNFKTTHGGTVKAFGSNGSITGQDAGLPNLDRFSGGIFMDDMHKPSEVHSDTIRESVKKNYGETIETRQRGPNVPIVFIGQRLQEEDLPNDFIQGRDGYEWRKVILKGLDEANNALHPAVMPKEKLLIMRDKRPYVFAAQQQQDPLPAGGGIYKPEWFIELDDEPEILATFITADTSETDKTYNDATVFSFWGIYKVTDFGVDIDLYNLHWLDCYEFWCEPKDLEQEFNDFYAKCMRHTVKLKLAAIEKKSTGVTLLSILKKRPGLQVIDIQRSKKDGSKASRFLDIQSYISSKRVTLPHKGKHNQMCIDHCKKITANNTHARDDIADTLYDGVKVGLIDDIVLRGTMGNPQTDEIVKNLAASFKRTQQIREQAFYGKRNSR